jgi:AP-2 complex subunit mu-1
VPRFQGLSEQNLVAEADLSTMVVQKAWSRPPISMEFQVWRQRQRIAECW